MGQSKTRFRYLRDPFFLVSLGIFLLNPWVIKQYLPIHWIHSYLNDVLCIPITVPIMVALFKRVGWRKHDGAPDVIEVLWPLVMWSIVFEVWLPRWPSFPEKMVADPLDVVVYAAGTGIAWVIWNWGPGARGIDADMASKAPEKKATAPPLAR